MSSANEAKHSHRLRFITFQRSEILDHRHIGQSLRKSAQGSLKRRQFFPKFEARAFAAQNPPEQWLVPPRGKRPDYLIEDHDGNFGKLITSRVCLEGLPGQRKDTVNASSAVFSSPWSGARYWVVIRVSNST